MNDKYKVKEILKMLEQDGWCETGMLFTQEYYHQYKHPTKQGIVTICGRANDVLNQFVLNSVWHQAGWK